MKKTITILGATGSIGTQALDVVRALGCTVIGLAAHKNIKLLEQQAREFNPRFVAIADESVYRDLKTALADTPITVWAGQQALAELAAQKTELALNAVVGIAGLETTIAALEAGNPLALANKESLVAGGDLVMALAQQKGLSILPVDSEHSAIFQALNGEPTGRIKKLLLTASGGPFFGQNQEQLKAVTVQQALAHPNWSMGSKITIDSATLMNKGLEFIEAMHLFQVQPSQIEILVHRQSIVHSAVEFIDGAVIAQLGAPDMRMPIQYAMTYPDRLPCNAPALSLTEAATLTFAHPDTETFVCLRAALLAAEKGGLYPAAVNGANEQAVALFLQDKIRFLDIGALVIEALSLSLKRSPYTLKDVFEADQVAREMVLTLSGRKV